MTVERIKIMMEMIDKNMSRGLNRLSKNFQGFDRVITANQDQFRDMRTSTGQLDKRFKALNNSGARFANKMRIGTAGLKGFRMEMLGVMFFGMSMTRLFGGMLRPVTEVFGVMDLWSETLSVLFLPTMQDLYPALLDVNSALMDLPVDAKKTIGGITLAGMGLGNVFAIGGTLALGIGSIITALGDTKDVSTLVKNSLSSLSKVIRGMSFVVGLAVTFKWAKDVSEMLSDFETSWTTRFKTIFEGIFAGGLIGFSFGGPAGALVGATIGLGLSLVINLLDIAWEKGFDQTMSDWVNGAIETIKVWINKITRWFVNLKLKFTGQGGGLDTEITYGDDGVGILKPKEVNDFIMRPGQQAVSMNPNDTIVGFKGNSPFGGGATINQTLNISVSNAEEMIRLIRGENEMLIRQLQRNT